MGSKANWTTKEIEYLEDKYGILSIKTIAAHLNRTPGAVINKKVRMGLGNFLDNGEYITFNQLTKALGITGGSGYMQISWVKNKDFPIKYKQVLECKFKIVYLSDFWKWAEKNRSMVNWNKVEKNILGAEPEWVDKQRKADFIKSIKVKTTPWSRDEDETLRSLLKTFKYSYEDLSKVLHRTNGAIQRRILDLEIKERPLKADNHVKWTDEEYFKLGEMIKHRYSYELMAEQLGKSAKAIRGRVYYMYLTENIDRAADLIGNGSWGDGRPERPITSRLLNIEEKSQVKKDLTHFVGILKGLICSHYDSNDYWQRELCKNWDNVCTAGERNCDECTSFIRIQPQYCRRCGATIINRKKVDICDRCKVQRKKQYQHKYMVLQGKRTGGQYGES